MVMLFQNFTGVGRTIYISGKFKTDLAQLQFQTLQDANGLCLMAGDQIKLAPGEVFRGPWILKLCDTEVNPGTISISSQGAYIYGTELLTPEKSWERVDTVEVKGREVVELRGKNIYRIGPFAPAKLAEIGDLYVNNLRRHVSSYHPRKGKVLKGIEFNPIGKYFPFDPSFCPQAGGCIHTTPGLLGVFSEYGATKGLYAIVRNTNWSYARSRVNYFHGGYSFALQDDINRPITGGRAVASGMGFALMNSVLFLDKPGSWATDEASGYIYFHSPENETPQTAAISDRNQSAVSADFRSKPITLNIEGITVLQAGGKGFSVTNLHSASFKRVKVAPAANSALLAYGLSGNFLLENSSFLDVSGNAIFVGGVKGEARIMGNSFTRIGRLGSQRIYDADFNGMRLGAIHKIVVAGNSFTEMGYSAVYFGSALGSTYIGNNKVNTYCLLLNDCGAIYSNGMAQVLQKDQYIVANQIYNGVGEVSTGKSGSQPMAPGIYLDVFASDYSISENEIVNAAGNLGAIFIHGGARNNIYRNKIVNSAGHGIMVSRNYANVPPVGRVLGVGNRAQSNTVEIRHKDFFPLVISDREKKFEELLIPGTNSLVNTVDPTKIVTKRTW